MCLRQRIVAFSAGGFSTASEQQFSSVPIYFSHTRVYLVYPRSEMSRAAHPNAGRELATKSRFLGGGEVYADATISLLNRVVSTLIFVTLWQRIFQYAFA